MKLMLKTCCLGFAGLLLIMVQNSAYGTAIYTSVFDTQSGTFNLFISTGFWWSAESELSGINIMTRATKTNGAETGLQAGFRNSYVPYTGQWRMRIHWCPTTVAASCTVASANGYADSAEDNLASGSLIINSLPHFGFPTGTLIPANSALCYSFVDSEGFEWKTDAMITCQDAATLPTTPATCYLNLGEDLDVDMGSLERGDIVTTPGTSASTVKKTVPVLCTRDAGTTVTTRFQFTPLTVSGKDVIQSSSNGLGIAIRYNHKIVGPSDSFTEDYAVGYTNIELEFEAVRDPAVAVKDVPTGDFTANAVMVMTQE